MSSLEVCAGHDRHLAALAGELAQDVALDAVVDGHHVELRGVLPAVALVPFPRRLVPGEALARRHHRHQIHAVEPRPRARFLLERVEVEPARRLVRDHGVRHAVDANAAGERAGVDAGDTDDAARLEPLVEVAGRAVVRGLGDRGVQHHAARARRGRHVHGLDVVLVGADIADMGEGEGDDLPGIGGIGEDLLVAGHGGVEAHLAHRMAGRAEAHAFDHGAVGEHEQRGRPWAPPRFARLGGAGERLPASASAGCVSVIEGLNLKPRRRSRIGSTRSEMGAPVAKGHSRAAR